MGLEPFTGVTPQENLPSTPSRATTPCTCSRVARTPRPCAHAALPRTPPRVPMPRVHAFHRMHPCRLRGPSPCAPTACTLRPRTTSAHARTARAPGLRPSAHPLRALRPPICAFPMREQARPPCTPLSLISLHAHASPFSFHHMHISTAYVAYEHAWAPHFSPHLREHVDDTPSSL